MISPIWRRLLMSFVTFARSKTLVRAGTAMPRRIAMVAITTSSSIRVNAGTIVGHVFCLNVIGTIFALTPEWKRKASARLLDKTLALLCM